MKLQIDICNSEIKENAKLLNNANIKSVSDATIKIDHVRMSGNSSALDNLQITDVIDELNAKIQSIDTKTNEYKQLKEILSIDISQKEKIKKALLTHLSDFSKGILASIIANRLT